VFNTQRSLVLFLTLLILPAETSAVAQTETVRIEWLEPTPSPEISRTPSKLEGLQQLALEHNPTLEQAREEIRRAQGIRFQAGSYPNPTVGYSGNEMGNEGDAGQQGPFISQEIVRGGKLRLSRTVESYAVRQADWSLKIQEQRVLNAVRRDFYAILAAEQTLELVEDLLKIAKEGRQAVEITLRDRGTRRDLNRAKLEVERAELLLDKSKNEFDASWRRLSTVVGKPELTPTALKGNLQQNIPNLTWKQAWLKVKNSSPLLFRAREGIARARAKIHLARAQPIPNVTIQASTQYDFATKNQIAGFQVQLPLPIRNRNQGNISAAHAEYLQAIREVDRLELQLQRSLASLFRDYAVSRKQAVSYHNIMLPLARETLETDQGLYKAGEINYIELLTAQRTYTQTVQEYVQSLAKLWDNIILIDGMLLSDGLKNPVASRDR